MLILNDLKKNMDLVNSIDWDMTPEEAVRLYLEWGNNWTHGKDFVRGKDDVSYYFVVNTWDETPKIYLIRRNSDEAVELATLEMPKDMEERFLEWVGHNKGVYAPNNEVRVWLEKEMYGPAH